jgi:hypothetical protein
VKKYNLVAEHLKEGQKITLVFQGELGGISAIPTTYLSCQPAPHYQNCVDAMIGVSILHKPAGKRTARHTTIAYNIPLAVYDGWQDIDTDSLVFKPLEAGVKISRYDMHDSRYFSDLIKAKPDGVIFVDMLPSVVEQLRGGCPPKDETARHEGKPRALGRER